MQGRVIENKLSIQVVQNKQLNCNGCLFSSEHSARPELVYCKLAPEIIEKGQNDFCGQGMWLMDGEIKIFKEAFKHMQEKERRENGRERKEERDTV